MEQIPQKKKFVLPFISKTDNQTHAIIIDSNFDSGNLGSAHFDTNGDDQKVSQYSKTHTNHKIVDNLLPSGH